MYLYKYLFKGPDRTMFFLQSSDPEFVDEILDYINACYLSASEAAWRILQYHISDWTPIAKSLSVHLPNKIFY